MINVYMHKSIVKKPNHMPKKLKYSSRRHWDHTI